MPSLWEQLAGARVYDLGQPYFTGMPHWPAHPPFLFGLTKQHGDMVGPAGNSSAADAMALGSHVGTHIDALCHFSCGGMLHGGHAVDDLQSYVRRAEEVLGGHRGAHPASWRAAGSGGGWRTVGGGLGDHAAATGGGPENGDPARRCRGAAYRMGSLLRGCAEVRERDATARSGPGSGAVAERPGNFRGGQRHGGVREIARGGDAGARAPAGGERDPHYRVFESGRTGGGRGYGVLVRRRADEDSRGYWRSGASAGAGGRQLTPSPGGRRLPGLARGFPVRASGTSGFSW